MKRLPILLGAAMAVVFSLTLWQQTQVKSLEMKLEVMRQEAARNGISLTVKAQEKHRIRVFENRPDAEAIAKSLMELLERMKEIVDAGSVMDSNLQDEIVKTAVKLAKVSPDRLREILVGVCHDSSLTGDYKVSLVCSVLMAVSHHDPKLSLEILDHSGDLFSNCSESLHVVRESVRLWAEQSPYEALTWWKQRDTPPCGEDLDNLKNHLLIGAAGSDCGPAEVFRIQSELGMVEDRHAYQNTVLSAYLKHGGKRLLEDMNKHMAELGETEARKFSDMVMGTMGMAASESGDESIRQWIERQKMPKANLVAFANGLAKTRDPKELAMWMHWVGAQLPADSLAEPVENLMKSWVRMDHQDAGNWLNGLPAGPLTHPAVKAYAREVAKHDPEIATQWAMTISDPSARRDTLTAIRDNWPSEDKEGATRFVEQHGLK